MASGNTEYIRAKNVRVYRDGEYLGTITSINTDSEQEMTTRQYVGDDEEIHIAGIKSFTGSINRDMVDESMLEAILQGTVTTKFAATNYENLPDAIHVTLDDLTASEDATFTTPSNANLKVESVTLNVKATDIDTEVLQVLVRDAGDTTTLATFSVDADLLPQDENEYITLYLDEANEVALSSSTNYILRVTTDDALEAGEEIELYKPTGEAEFYYAITYESTTESNGDYTMDIVMAKDDGTEVAVIRDTCVTFLSDGVTISAGEPIGESISWRAKKREIL